MFKKLKLGNTDDTDWADAHGFVDTDFCPLIYTNLHEKKVDTVYWTRITRMALALSEANLADGHRLHFFTDYRLLFLNKVDTYYFLSTNLH